MVSSAELSVLDAAYARRHPEKPAFQRRKPLRKTGTFKPEPLSKKKRSLTRSLTMPIESIGRRFFKLRFLRGLNAFLIMSVSQWYLGAITDFFLSGQPKELLPGYGSSSIILAVFFGGGSALWTHYAITEPSTTDIYNDFPRGSDVLVELFPITCLWAVCEQITISLPLALSRSHFFDLRDYAWEPARWNPLDMDAQRLLLFKFSVVYLLYLVLVAALSIPCSIMLRRIHASMLPEADAAFVPYHRGNPQPREDDESSTHKPGLSVSEAWSTLTWADYRRVLVVFVQYFLLNQSLHFLCWEAELRLHDFFKTDQFTSLFPSGPTRLSLRILGGP